ncbi:MAG: hypothetical protein ABS35_34385 [Kaistia sp. SCN 65-12]|nr:MAG: hypothetical protein ABS35_34385 [Kaistia sp. SCN 65-12]
MTRRIAIRTLHAVAGSVALLAILLFQTTTIASEIIGDHALIASVKFAIATGLLVLVPALAATGGSGFKLSGPRPKGLAATKLGRMKIVAANGLLVLVPAALFLNWKAQHGAFDPTFWIVQVAEIAAGIVNLALLGLNMRDGLRMTGRLGRGKPRLARPV